MNKPTVGQVLFSLNIGDAARHTPSVLSPVVVAKVGRKYFTTTERDGPYKCETEWHLDTLRQRTDRSARAALYVSERAYEDEKLANGICRLIGTVFQYGSNNYCNVPLDTLVKIKQILDEVGAKERVQ